MLLMYGTMDRSPRRRQDDEATVKRLQEQNAVLLGRLRAMEWEGYDAEAGERACPNCGAWKFQPSRMIPIHAFQCALADLIGSPMETPEGMDRGEFWGSSEQDDGER